MKRGSTINIPVELIKNKDFTKWLTSAEGRVWLNLFTKIIRRPNNKGFFMPNLVYKKFYLNNKLATSWALSQIAEDLGYGSCGKSNICKLIKKLEKKQYLKKHIEYVDSKKYTVYELGYINSTQDTEINYVFERFTESISKKKLIKNGVLVSSCNN